MSAIAGIISFSSPSQDLHSSLEQQLDALAHRGKLLSPKLALDGALMQGRQHSKGIYPVHSACNDQVMALVDGSFSNVEELAATARFDTDNNAAIVLKLYRAGGIEALKILQGCFAIALYDATKGQLFLFRDMFAGRPLYYGQQNDHIWIASDIKAILAAPGFKRAVNTQALSQELTFRSNFGPATLFKDIYKVPPGYCCFGSIEANLGVKLHTDFTFPVKKRQPSKTFEQRIWRRLGATMTRMLQPSQHPERRSGILLSGGIDSALLLKKQQELQIPRRRAICCGFADDDARDMDESALAQTVATACSTDLSQVGTSAQDNLLGSLRRIIHALEEPSRTVISIPTERALAQNKEHIDCLLTGVMADLLFGEPGQYDTPIASFRRKAPRFVLQALRRALPLLKKIPKIQGYAHWFERGDQPTLKQYILTHQRFNGTLRDVLPPLDSNQCALHIDELTQQLQDAHSEDEFAIVFIMMYAHGWNDVFDKLAAAHSLEVLHPFEDPELLQISLEMPYGQKIARHFTKPVLRHLAATLFSPEFAYAEKKIFTSPAAIWLRDNTELRQFALGLKSDRARLHRYLNSEAVVKLIARYEHQLETHRLSNMMAQIIYTLINFELWLEIFFDQNPDSGGAAPGKPGE